jgi:hypothetical protein
MDRSRLEAAAEGMRFRNYRSVILILACLVSPNLAAAQRGGDLAQFDARLSMLQHSLAELSAQIEQLKARDQQLQQQFEKMRANFNQRLERLEGEAASKPTPGRRKP